MKNIIYCKKCLIPNTRPNIYFDKNKQCNVCSSKKVKKKINWRKRNQEFKIIVNSVKKKKLPYDCLIPVSGGKDSTWQVITALKYKMKPLCVTWKTPVRTKIGEENLQNLIRLGVDHIDFSINPIVEKKFVIKAFSKYGNPLLPMHMAFHSIPVRIAIEKKIPLIIWGENSADEYGGKKYLKGPKMTNKWRSVYGLTHKTHARDWIDKTLSRADLDPYFLPTQKKILSNGIKEIFLGYYFKWDPNISYKIAKSYGFKSSKKAKLGLYKFADIDDQFMMNVGHWMKWYKFGLTRLWDNIAIEIRNNRLSKLKAIDILKKENLPINEIKKFCSYTNISNKKFFSIANKFRNKSIWSKENKKWKINNFLIKNWNWKSEI